MAELADAYDSGSYRSNSVEVQVLLPAPKILVSFDTGIFLFAAYRFFIPLILRIHTSLSTNLYTNFYAIFNFSLTYTI